MLKSKNSLIITVLTILLILTSCGPINYEKITSSIVNRNNFDQKIVITGPFNPSKNGDENNDDNILIITS